MPPAPVPVQPVQATHSTHVPMQPQYEHPPPQLLEYACSSDGAHFVCSKLRGAQSFEVFYSKLLPLVPQLMLNSLGHSVCRAIYDAPHCSQRQKQLFLRALLPTFTSIATNQQGSFALICIFTLMSTAAEIDIVAQGFASREDFDAILMCQSGYHVLKKFLDFGFPHFEEVLAGISADFRKYACHHYGVPIIRCILDTLAADERLINHYLVNLQALAMHSDVLVSNQHGNYVIQQLLEISPPAVTDIIQGRMQKKFAFFAKQKFASNVVEKCIKLSLGRRSHAGHDWTQIVMHELLRDARRLINHKFGNYCLQTALSACIAARRKELLREFVDTVRPLLHHLRINVRKKWQLLLFEADNTRRFGEEHHAPEFQKPFRRQFQPVFQHPLPTPTRAHHH